MESQDLETIKKTVREFFEKATFDMEIESFEQKEETLSVNLKLAEPQIFIGEGGQTLSELQHLLKLILRKKIKKEEPFYFDLDINNYKRKKFDYLREMARSLADEVSLTKKEKELPPMPAYERRVIHLELANRSDVKTESQGEEPERKILIKPQ